MALASDHKGAGNNRLAVRVIERRATAAEAEVERLREAQSTALSLLGNIIKECHNAGLPNEIAALGSKRTKDLWPVPLPSAAGRRRK
jgi:hypothetical protein